MKNLIKIILLSVIFLLMFISTVFAQQQFPLFTLQKDNTSNIFDDTCSPGETSSISFSLENKAEQENSNTLLLYDAITRNNGGTKIQSVDNYTTDEVAAWFEFDATVITLDAGKTTDEITIEFTVPEDTPPGNYAAILAYNKRLENPVEATNAEEYDVNGEESGVGLRIIKDMNITTDIIIRVPGEYQRNMTLDEGFLYRVDNSKLNMSYFIPFSNNSTVYDFPSFEVKVFNEKEEIVFENRLKANIAYANQSAYYVSVDTVNDYDYGEYRVEAIMNYGNDEFDGKEERTYYFTLEKDVVEDIQEKKEDRAIEADTTLTKQQKWWLKNITLIKVVVITTLALMLIAILYFIYKLAKKKDRNKI